MKVIGHIRTDFPSKFGIPRQSGLIDGLKGKIILEPLDFKHLKEHLPEFQYIKTDIDIYQFNPPIDSSDMSTDSWIKLVSIIGEQ